MDKHIRNAQIKLLKAFAKKAKTFALAGGAALELYYLKHRFSRDLDFFSPDYNLVEVNSIVTALGKAAGSPLKQGNEFFAPGMAKVRFYSAKAAGTTIPLKIDFIQDVFFDKAKARKFKGVPVYDAKNIYFHKIITLTGVNLTTDEIGRETMIGRQETRDIIDVYYLSKKIIPLHKFMKTLDRQHQRGLIKWHRAYSRQETKLGALDLEIYDKHFDASKMISYLDEEINKFVSEEII